MKKAIIACITVCLLHLAANAQNVNLLATLPVGGSVSDLQFAGHDTGYCIIGIHAYRSDNGGLNWTKISEEQFGGAYFYRSLCVVSANRVLLGKNSGGRLLISNDAGTTWVEKKVGVNNMITGISFMDAQNGYLVTSGNSGSVGQVNFLKTTDGGETWSTPLPLPVSGYDAQVLFVNPLKGFIWYQKYVYATNDGGATWTASPDISDNVYTLSFIDANTGWAGGRSRYFLKTTDGGATWNEVLLSSASGIGHINKLHFSSATQGYMMDYNSSEKRIRKTYNAGTSWDTLEVGINAINLFYNDPQHIWLFGSNNNIYTLGTTTGAPNHQNQERIQLYPNPATDIIYVGHEHRGPEPALISIYSLSGEKLMQSPSYGKTSIDISHLPAGAYLLRSEQGMPQLLIKAE